MKKFFNFFAVVILMALTAGLTANAQTSTPEVNNYAGHSRFFDNWSIGLEGGVQMNLQEWNAPQGGVAGLTLNKQITPAFGISFEGYTGFNNTANWYVPVNHMHNMNVVDNVNVYVTGRWNLMNSFAGYDGMPRIFELETDFGVGYGRFFYNSVVADDYNCILGKLGLNLNFNLGVKRAWTLSLKPAFVWNFSDAPRIYTSAANNKNAVFQLTAGVAYHFMTSNGKHYIATAPVDEYARSNAELNELVNQLRAENLALAEAAKMTTTVIEQEVMEVTKLVDSTYVIQFAFDNAVLSTEAKANLDKVPACATVNVVAYASPEGPANYNKSLSLERANAVADYLKNRGVKVANITGDGAPNVESNRIAIVTVTE